MFYCRYDGSFLLLSGLFLPSSFSFRFPIVSWIQGPFLPAWTENQSLFSFFHSVISSVPGSLAFLKCQCTESGYCANEDFSFKINPDSRQAFSTIASIRLNFLSGTRASLVIKTILKQICHTVISFSRIPDP